TGSGSAHGYGEPSGPTGKGRVRNTRPHRAIRRPQTWSKCYGAAQNGADGEWTTGYPGRVTAPARSTPTRTGYAHPPDQQDLAAELQPRPSPCSPASTPIRRALPTPGAGRTELAWMSPGCGQS